MKSVPEEVFGDDARHSRLLLLHRVVLRVLVLQLAHRGQRGHLEGRVGGGVPRLGAGFHVHQGADLLAEGQSLIGRNGRFALFGQNRQSIPIRPGIRLTPDQDDRGRRRLRPDLGAPTVQRREQRTGVRNVEAEQEDVGLTIGRGTLGGLTRY